MTKYIPKRIIITALLCGTGASFMVGLAPGSCSFPIIINNRDTIFETFFASPPRRCSWAKIPSGARAAGRSRSTHSNLHVRILLLHVTMRIGVGAARQPAPGTLTGRSPVLLRSRRFGAGRTVEGVGRAAWDSLSHRRRRTPRARDREGPGLTRG